MKNAIQMIALSSLLLSASVASAETVVANLSQPFGLAMAPNGNLWVSQYNNGHISVLSPTADRVLSTFAAAPEVTDAAFAGNLAIYSSEYGNAVYAVNATTHAPVYEIPVYSAAVA